MAKKVNMKKAATPVAAKKIHLAARKPAPHPGPLPASGARGKERLSKAAPASKTKVQVPTPKKKASVLKKKVPTSSFKKEAAAPKSAPALLHQRPKERTPSPPKGERAGVRGGHAAPKPAKAARKPKHSILPDDRPITVLDLVAALRGDGKGTLVESDGELEVAARRVGAAERVDVDGAVDELVGEQVNRLLEQLDRLTDGTVAERDLAEPGEGTPAFVGRHRPLERGAVEIARDVDVGQAQGDLCIHERLRIRLRRRLRAARRQEVLGDAEAPPHLAQELERGDAGARLDPRDVRGGAAREGQVALAEARCLASRAEPSADRGRVVDVL